MIYKNIYYRINRFAYFLGRKEEYAAYSSCIMFSLLLSFNVLTVIKFTGLLTKIPSEFIFVFIIIAALNVYFFVIKKEYKKLIAKYSQESLSSKIAGIALGLVYCFLTIYLFFEVLK